MFFKANLDLLRLRFSALARWQSGHAAACKAVYAGSIPTLASSAIKDLAPMWRFFFAQKTVLSA